MKAVARIALPLILIVFHCLNAICQSISGVVNSYYSITAVNTAANTITVSDATGLSAGQTVLIIQMKGATVTATNTSAYGNITAINDAGNYEFNIICSVNGNIVLLQNELVNAYDPAGQAQLISYPSYSSVTVSGPILSQPWNSTGGTGGVVVLAATNTITLNANIDVSGQGFEGGALVNWPVPPYNCDFLHTENAYYYDTATTGYLTAGKKGQGIAATIANEGYGMGKLANAGGGGNNANSGGAGGGNYGEGGAGGKRAGESEFDCQANYPGIGALSLSAYGYTAGVNRIFLGGGGGSGEENNGVGEGGANGGGIIILAAPTIMGGGGQLLANGAQPSNPACTNPLVAEGDGGGGGGAGGTIILNATTISGSITAQATGGAGSNSSEFVDDCTGPGGGGGGGVIWAAGGSFPGAVTGVVNGGANGIVALDNAKAACRGLSNGATSGASGVLQAGYVAPVSTGSVCIVLATPVLQYFTGTRSDAGVVLTWALSSVAIPADIRSFVLQRAVDTGGFVVLANLPVSTDVTHYNYTDPARGIEGPVSYRLSWQDQTGAWFYSAILVVTLTPGPDAASMTLQPNPATDQVTVTVYSWSAEKTAVTMYNVLGQPVLSRQVSLNKGVNSVVIPLGDLAPAVYFLVLNSAGGRQGRGFVKR
jgi:Secretion system C-terminal sorting domain